MINFRYFLRIKDNANIIQSTLCRLLKPPLSKSDIHP
eukprot:UN01509